MVEHLLRIDQQQCVAMASAMIDQPKRWSATSRSDVENDLALLSQWSQFIQNILEDDFVLAGTVGIGEAYFLIAG